MQIGKPKKVDQITNHLLEGRIMQKAVCTGCCVGRTEVTTFMTRWGNKFPLCVECLHKRGATFVEEIESTLQQLKAEGRENEVGCTADEILEDRLASVQEDMGEPYALLMYAYFMSSEG
jgi:hypothetical protein